MNAAITSLSTALSLKFIFPMHFNLEKRVPPAELLFKNNLEDRKQYCILKDPYIRTFINIVYAECVMCCVGSSAALRSIMSAVSGLRL